MAVFLFSAFIFITLLGAGLWPAFAVESNKMKMEMKKWVPPAVGMYKSDGKDQFFDRMTSFRYMDGAAELYRSYRFKLLMVRRYLQPDGPPIMIELFDMGLSEEAFGIFSYETGGEEVGVGQGSDYGGGLLRFWKGKYFVNVFGEKETPSMRKDVLEIGKAISNSIVREGPRPKLINILPREDLLERNVRYFHFYQGLNYHYFLSHENILQLGEHTHSILATYLFHQTEVKTFLLLIQYPTLKRAGEALRSFGRAYMPEAPASIMQKENGKWAAARVNRNYVTVVFDAPSKEKAEELMEATHMKLIGR